MRSLFLNGRILPKALLQALVLFAILLLPNTAWGQTITVAGLTPNSDTGNVSGEGITGTVAFSSSDNTLTLENATIEGGIEWKDTSTVKVSYFKSSCDSY